jgi:hypothetical protein
MSQITLQQIEAAHKSVAEMIEAFKSQGPTTYGIPQALIELQPGERYAGLLLDDQGEPSAHLILMPGEAEGVTWQAALDWAAEIGGELPTRQEQSLLFANLKSEFQPKAYWSNTQYSDNSAWCQDFDIGDQFTSLKSAELRARAVRRLSV